MMKTSGRKDKAQTLRVQYRKRGESHAQPKRDTFRKTVPNSQVQQIANTSKSSGPTEIETLCQGTYRPGDIRRVWIPKAGGGERGLGIPNVVDRVVGEAVRGVLSPRYEPRFHESSHGFRPKRSCHSAIAQAKEILKAGFDTVVDIDLKDFFNRVHHQRLLAVLQRDVGDARVLRLIGRMLKAKVVMPDGVRVNNENGVPQGTFGPRGPLSPLLSNIVLDELDRELSRRKLHFVRYADDCAPRRAEEKFGYEFHLGSNCTRDEGGPLELRLQGQGSNHRKLLWPNG